ITSSGRVVGTFALSFPLVGLETSRSSFPGQQDRRAQETGDDAKQVECSHAHHTVQRIRVAEWPQRTHVGVHDPIEHGMENSTENPTHHGDWHPVFGAESFRNYVPRPRQPPPYSGDDEPAQQADQTAEEKSVRLTM